MKPATLEAYQLMHDGALALARVEAAGMRIDMQYLKRVKQEVSEEMAGIAAELRQHRIYRLWQKHFGKKCNLQSKLQLARILFDVLEYPVTQWSKGHKPSTDEAHLMTLNEPFVERYLSLMKLQKLEGTYLRGIEREICDGYLHPSFNLHTTRTFRSSCSDPNFQNIPTRNPKIAKIIRSAFIPREGRVLVEFDYSQIEVRVAACYHKDPTMLKYIEEGHDFHKDLAQQLYCLKPEQVEKGARTAAKNSFVFAEFYGDYYIHVAKNLWDAIGKHNLKCGDISLYQHLRKHGIKELGELDSRETPKKGTFEHHVWSIEKDFWEQRFAVYNRWRKQWWERYQQRGWFHTLTGFSVAGVYRRNEVINSPIQGSAFHCLLWSLIEISRRLRKYKLKSIIIGQIHDSLVLDVVRSELKAVLSLVHEVMVDALREHWKWIITPIEIEAEMAETNWFEKKGIEI